MPLETPLIYALIVIGAILACLVIIYSMRKRRKGEEEFSEVGNLKLSNPDMPFKITKTVPRKKVGRAQTELRLLGLEREILSDAIRRLYEAHADGRITAEERDKIAQSYKARIRRVKEAIAKDESVIALHELESMQEDLFKMFSDRFEELSGKIEGLRSRLEVEPVREIPVPPRKKTPKKPEKTKTSKKTRKKPPKKTKKKPSKETAEKPKKKQPREKEKKKEEDSRPKTEAEKKVDQIREEVEKVLDRLGQMEVET